MSFRITGLAPEQFAHLWGLDEAGLAAHRAVRVVADEEPGFPDRIGMRDARVGETLILVNYEHLPVASPYRASHAIYVAEGAEQFDAVDEVPLVLRRRLISLRAYDAAGMMRDADVLEGEWLVEAIERMFGDPKVAFLHAHNARPGCFAAGIQRNLLF
jgi:hypothetical protein